ncbi:acyltransferase [Pantoea dispersa]|uniref:acyltransferase family protein n=1 Tax=Pantoea dispersa TaxID=59814 RepID=UPI0023A9B2A0|nr:acyltransferase [Pantoea dispersa]WEA07162.1 acyltransferase [Pantoea dispersa]
MNNVKHRIEALDGLRFLAILMVLFYHYLFIAPLQGFLPREYNVPSLVFGDYGVDLFFLISGFVITLSSENRSVAKFSQARFNRIFPMFFICAFIVYFFSISLPMVDSKERLSSLFYSLTFFPNLFGKDYFSSVYWTIQVEVTFYIFVALFMWVGVWEKKKHFICSIWLAISYANNFIVDSHLITTFLLTRYAGHFVIGIVLFELRTSRVKPVHLLLILFSLVLIYNSMLQQQLWIDGFGIKVDHASLLMMAVLIVGVVWVASNIESLGRAYKFVKFLGAMTYPLYLIHADLGFWSHAIFERKLWAYDFFKNHVGYYSTIFLAMFLSLFLSALLVKFVDPFIQLRLKKIWERKKNISDLA